MNYAVVTALLIANSLVFGQTPDTFTWLGGAGSATWDDFGVWEPAETARTAPGIAGDILRTTTSANIFLSGDKTITRIIDGGDRLVFRNNSGTAHTITFDSGDPAVTNFIQLTRTPFHACTVNATPDNDMIFDIKNGLRWNAGVWDNNNFRVNIGAKITGGNDPEPPLWLQFDSNAGDWGHCFYVMLNQNNDFRGDVHLGRDGMNNTLHFQIGHGGTPGYNSILGHPDNRIFLHGGWTTLRVKSGDPGGFRRTVIGNGTLGGNEINGDYNGFNPSPLLLGAGCSLEPMVLPSNPVGTITLTTIGGWGGSATVTAHEDAQVVLSLGNGGACGKLNFNSSGAVNYSGKVILVPQDDYAPG
ncbi:MAG: hypothetical protein FWG05_06370, partial [Kiritimatiellaeota bacterium]|nr:hypothetical protein [Kiritimatiellota bacterium]